MRIRDSADRVRVGVAPVRDKCPQRMAEVVRLKHWGYEGVVPK